MCTCYLVQGHGGWNGSWHTCVHHKNTKRNLKKATGAHHLWPVVKVQEFWRLLASGKSFTEGGLWFLPAFKQRFVKGSAPSIIYVFWSCSMIACFQCAHEKCHFRTRCLCACVIYAPKSHAYKFPAAHRLTQMCRWNLRHMVSSYSGSVI